MLQKRTRPKQIRDLKEIVYPKSEIFKWRKLERLKMEKVGEIANGESWKY